MPLLAVRDPRSARLAVSVGTAKSRGYRGSNQEDLTIPAARADCPRPWFYSDDVGEVTGSLCSCDAQSHELCTRAAGEVTQVNPGENAPDVVAHGGCPCCDAVFARPGVGVGVNHLPSRVDQIEFVRGQQATRVQASQTAVCSTSF